MPDLSPLTPEALRRESVSGPGPSAAGTELPGGSSSGEEGLCEDQSEGELSGSEEEVVPRTVPTARDSRRSADGIASTQPVGQVPGVGAGSRRARGPLSGVAVADSIGIISTWIKKSVSAGTWAAYEKVWLEWSSLVKESEVHLSGPEVRTLVWYFLSRNIEAGVSQSVLDKKLAGLAFLFKWQGLPDFTKDFWVRQALKGYRKQGRRLDTRRPVSFDILKGLMDMMGTVGSSGFEVTLFRAAFALAFFGAFRIGELVSPSKMVQGGMGASDVGWAPEGVTLWLRRSKTDQSGKGRAVQVFPIEGSELCPVGLVRKYLDIRPEVGGTFLVHENGAPLSRYQFVAVFRKCLGELGLVAKEFSAHSFRIGAATEAARNGLGEDAIKRIGRWESKRFCSYVRLQLVANLC
ncbi:integrase/recombinase xerD homolog [Rana temporaria]|uniref:integrase/recombinase xerD homolog n=1 Tax=Rana temporaria TaxID=8407 RepID=UPI001AAD2E70|nr:integrase/recombinase xerD homolog [Rana temporaria]